MNGIPGAASARPRSFLTEPEWLLAQPLIDDIQRLKKRRNALVLAHNYQTADIFHGVADLQGDSLALARHAARSDADVLVMAGVSFMAETAKLLCPQKTVLLPDLHAGCSLAESITPQDIRELRRAHPGAPVVCYVNTSAAVKAECDVCCTSANAIQIVESLRVPRVILVPDEYLSAHVAARTQVEIIAWSGHCEVHERFTAREVDEFRRASGAYVLAHPECPPDVQGVADYVGSTAGMIDELAKRKPARAMLVTECSMADNVAVTQPGIEFVRPCNLCPHMKRITLEKIRDCLENMSPAVEVPPGLAASARRAVQRMIEGS